MFKPIILALSVFLAVPLVAEANVITLVPSVTLHIGDRDSRGNYWDGGHWRGPSWWRSNYQWRNNSWHRHYNSKGPKHHYKAKSSHKPPHGPSRPQGNHGPDRHHGGPHR